MARGDGSSNNELFKRNYLHLAPPVSRSPPPAYQKSVFTGWITKMNIFQKKSK